MGKGCPPKPPSYVRAGDWFRHVGQDGAWMWPSPIRTPEAEGDEDEDQTEEDKLKLPPIFQFRSRKNYRVERWEGIHLFRNVFKLMPSLRLAYIKSQSNASILGNYLKTKTVSLIID